jgi:hypothetical protein
MRRTVTVALVVGTLLTVINQGDRLVSGDADLVVALRIAANYLIPWVVSSIGYISARRAASAGDVGARAAR